MKQPAMLKSDFTLPEAEYFLLFDTRDERHSYNGLRSKQFDPDPAQTKKILAHRIKSLKAFPIPKEWTPDMGDVTDPNFGAPLAFAHPDFDRQSNQYHRHLAFKTNRPPILSHWFEARDYALPGSYRLASAQWASAIEQSESKTNTWLPVTLQFADVIVEGYKIAAQEAGFPRTSNMPAYADPIDLKRTAPVWHDALRSPQFCLATPSNRPVGKRSLLHGTSWRARWSLRYASRAVAMQLNELILPRERPYLSFIPLQLADS